MAQQVSPEEQLPFLSPLSRWAPGTKGSLTLELGRPGSRRGSEDTHPFPFPWGLVPLTCSPLSKAQKKALQKP